MTKLDCAPPDQMAGASVDPPRPRAGVPPPAPGIERSRLFRFSDGDRLEDAGLLLIDGGRFSRTESFESVRRANGGRTLTSVIVAADGSYRVEGRWTYDADETAQAAQGLADYGGLPAGVAIRVADAVATSTVSANDGFRCALPILREYAALIITLPAGLGARSARHLRDTAGAVSRGKL